MLSPKRIMVPTKDVLLAALVEIIRSEPENDVEALRSLADQAQVFGYTELAVVAEYLANEFEAIDEMWKATL